MYTAVYSIHHNCLNHFPGVPKTDGKRKVFIPPNPGFQLVKTRRLKDFGGFLGVFRGFLRVFWSFWCPRLWSIHFKLSTPRISLNFSDWPRGDARKALMLGELAEPERRGRKGMAVGCFA